MSSGQADRPVRVAVVGHGLAGAVFHVPLIQATSGLEVAVVVSSRPRPDDPALTGVPFTADLDAALVREDIDVIAVAVPNRFHAELTRRALEAGHHVVVDKPFTLDLDEARELLALARRRDRIVAVFHNRRWDSDFLGVRRVIADGLLGRVTHLESHIDRFRPQVRQAWREAPEPGGGLWYDLGPHLIDQALQLFGVPAAVTARLGTLRDGARTNDWAHAVLEYDRVRVVLHASLLAAGGTARFTVHGSHGSLVKVGADPQEAQLRAGLRPGASGFGHDDDAMRLYAGDGTLTRLPTPAGDQSRFYAHMRDAVRGAGPPPVTGGEALAVMAVLEAAAESARTGRTLAPPLTDAERRVVGTGTAAAPDEPTPRSHE